MHAWIGGYTFGDGNYYSDGMGIVDNNVLLRQNPMNYFNWNEGVPDISSNHNGQSIDRSCIKTNVLAQGNWDDYECCDTANFVYCEIRYCKTCNADTTILPVEEEVQLEQVSPKCFTCPDGFSADLNNTCVRNVYPTTSTPTEVVELAGNISVRLVSGEGSCANQGRWTPMYGRVEVNFNGNLKNLDKFQGITEINENEWLTVNTVNFGSLEGENLCKAFFGYGAKVRTVYKLSECGQSESRSISFDCSSALQFPFYNGSFQTYYRYEYPTHDNIFPNGCDIEEVFAGCTFEGCELPEPEGFAFGPVHQEEVGLACRCDEGFDFDGSRCARIEIIPTTEPEAVIREVEVSGGKIRLVGGGNCDPNRFNNEMVGRIEYQVQ